MSQYFIAGRPINLGFCGYSPTFDLTSRYNLEITATLIQNGQEVTSTTNQVTLSAETMVTSVASALNVFGFEVTPDGLINGVDVGPNDAIKFEIKRTTASMDEDVELTRLLKDTFELSFA